MKTTFATICLNEAEFIGANIRQHLEHCDEWLFVEGACKGYPPDRVSPEGLSTDGTADIIRSFNSPKIRLIQHGWTNADGEAAKSELRNRYAELVDHGGIVLVIDADEFLSHASMRMLLSALESMPGHGSFRIPHIHAWKHPLQIITGGYADVPHDRAYRWIPGSRYVNHNHPEFDGRTLQSMDYRKCERVLLTATDGMRIYQPEPFWFHVGFCKSPENVCDKNTMYANRGEASTRPRTTEFRKAWFTDELPPGCKLHPFAFAALPESLQ